MLYAKNLNMKAKTWDQLWNDEETKLVWSEPDKKVEEFLPQLQDEKVDRVLDLGCGLGRHTILLAKSGFSTYAMDVSEQGLEHCRTRLKTEGIQASLHHGKMDSLPFSNGFFDFILSWNVVYHSTREGVTKTLREVFRVLRTGGVFYLTLNSTRNEWFGKGTEIEANVFVNPAKGDGQHLHYFSDKDIVHELLSGWHIEAMKEEEQTFAGKCYPDSWHWTIQARKS